MTGSRFLLISGSSDVLVLVIILDSLADFLLPFIFIYWTNFIIWLDCALALKDTQIVETSIKLLIKKTLSLFQKEITYSVDKMRKI